MVKYSDGTHHTTKMNLLKKVLSIITSALQKDYETRGTEFNGMPFHRILIIMFNEPTVAYSVLEPMLWNIFETFGLVEIYMLQRTSTKSEIHALDTHYLYYNLERFLALFITGLILLAIATSLGSFLLTMDTVFTFTVLHMELIFCA